MTAHYFSTKTQKFVAISKDTRPVGETFPVAGKVEAREVAQQHGAKPWNF